MAVMAVGVAQATITVNDANQTVTITGSENKNISPDSSTTGSTVKTDAYAQAIGIPSGYTLVLDTEAGNAQNNWLANNSHTYDGLLQIGDGVNDDTTGFVLTNGNGGTRMNFTGKVTGSGILHKSSGGSGMVLTFSGDVTEYTGNMNLNASVSWTLSFGNGGAAAATTETNGASGTGTITFNSGNNNLVYNYSHGETPVYLTNAIVKGNNGTVKVALNGGADYILTKNATINTLSFADSSTLQVAAGSTLNLDVNATQVAPEGNGYGASTYNVGNALSLAEGATLQLNGNSATLDQGVVTSTGTVYFVNQTAEFNSTEPFTNATGVTVNNGATMRITGHTSDNNGIIKGAVTVKTGGVLQLEANDALGWSGNNVKTLLVEDGAEVKLTHDSNETFGGVLTLQGNGKITGDNARWDFFTDSSITVAANADAAINTKGLQLRHANSQATISLGNNATLAIGAKITNGDRGDGALVITANNGSNSVVNLNGGAEGVALQFGGVTANINKDMSVTQLMLSKNNALTTVNVAAGKTVTITGTSMPNSNGSFELANWGHNNVLNIAGTLIANSGITTEGGNACPVVNVKDGGTLSMNAGLNAVKRESGSGHTTINVESGATLNVGGTADLADTGLIIVNMQDGSTLGGSYGEGTTAVINKNFVLAENASVTLQTAADKELTLNGTFGGATNALTAQGGGTVTLAGTDALASMTVSESTQVIFGSDISLGSLTLANGSAIDFGTDIAVSATNLTLGSGITLGSSLSDALTALTKDSSLTLFSGTTGLTIGSDSFSAAMDAAGIFGGLETGKYTLDFSDSNVFLTLTDTTPTFSGDIVIDSDTDEATVPAGEYTSLTGESGYTLSIEGETTITGDIAMEAGSTATIESGASIANKGVTIAGAADGSTSLGGTESGASYTVTNGDVTVDTTAAAPVTMDAALTDSSLTNESSQELTVTGGDSTLTSITIGEDTAINFTNVTTEVEVDSLTLNADSVIGVFANAETLENTEKTLTVTGTMTVKGDASMNANLVVEDGAALNLDGSVTMGCTVTLGQNLTLTLTTDPGYDPTTDLILLFDSAESVTLGVHIDTEYEWLKASEVFSTVTIDNELVNIDDYVVGVWNNRVFLATTQAAPEPATATLSLLALAGLMARRRRH